VFKQIKNGMVELNKCIMAVGLTSCRSNGNIIYTVTHERLQVVKSCPLPN